MGQIHLSATIADSGSVIALGNVLQNWLPAPEIAAIRAIAAGNLDLPCTVIRKTVTHDGYLGNVEQFTPIASVMAGMSEPTAGQLANYDYLIGSLATWQVRLPYGTDVQAQDHLAIADKPPMIVQVRLAPRSFASLVTVLASEIEVK